MRMMVTRRTRPGPQSGYAIVRCRLGWIVQRWHATQHGRRYDARIFGGPFARKRDAVEARRKLIEGGARE